MSEKYRWDLFVRFTHWVVAGSFFANYLVTEEGSQVHRWVGYTMITVVCLRLLWGLIVKSPARLSAFKPSVPKAIAHLREVMRTREDQHQGHNPAGAVMVWVLWSGLLITGISGWATQWDMFWGVSWVEEVHETFANLTMIAVVVHVSAVVFMTHWTKHNYIRAMWFRR